MLNRNNAKKMTHKRKFSYTKMYMLLGILFLIVGIFSITQLNLTKSTVLKKQSEAKEKAMPAKVQLTIINSDCEDCSDLTQIISLVESSGVDITETTEVNFSDANDLIEQYQIERLPTIILTGELDKPVKLMTTLKEIGETKDNTYILTDVIPPYLDARTGEVKGKVSLILIRTDCEKCADINLLVSQLQAARVSIQIETLDINTSRGKSLIEKYSITKVPTILIDAEIEAYPDIKTGLIPTGTFESDGWYVLRKPNPPYYDLVNNETKGLITVTFLEDPTCEDCYDPAEFHKPILQKMGLPIGEENTVESTSTEGKDLIDTYGIKKLPTILLAGDVDLYPGFAQVWQDVGTVESDGTYIFRRVEVANQPYTNTTSGESASP